MAGLPFSSAIAANTARTSPGAGREKIFLMIPVLLPVSVVGTMAVRLPLHSVKLLISREAADTLPILTSLRLLCLLMVLFIFIISSSLMFVLFSLRTTFFLTLRARLSIPLNLATDTHKEIDLVFEEPFLLGLELELELGLVERA